MSRPSGNSQGRWTGDERFLAILLEVGHAGRLHRTAAVLVVERLARGDQDGAVRFAGSQEEASRAMYQAIEEAGPPPVGAGLG